MADERTLADLAAKHLFAASRMTFFGDPASTEIRVAAESKRAKTPAQRAARKRLPRVRTVQMGLRTTPAIKALIEALRGKLGEQATATDAIEAAVIELARAHGLDVGDAA